MKVFSLVAVLLFSIGVSSAQTMNETQGTGAGTSITSGDYNAVYGDSAGYNTTTGSRNTFMGSWSGYSNVTHFDNTFIGYQAGMNATSAFNTFIGSSAGLSNTTGNYNTFLGHESGTNNTTGYYNTFLGRHSGYNNTIGQRNVFVGEKSGYSNTSGYYNTFVGRTAGYSNTTGRQNTFVGQIAGYDNTTGWWNTAVGDSAGLDNSVGHSNTFIGHGSGSATEYASNNTFVGNNAGWDNNRTNIISSTSAQRNTYLGSNAGFSNRSGSDNIGIGAFADFNNLDYSRCLFMGSGGSAYDNAGVGGFEMVGANDVIVFGYQALNNAQYSIGIGNSIEQRGLYSITLGHDAYTSANSNYAVQIGGLSWMNAAYNVSIGHADTITGARGVSIGYDVNLSADSSVVIGASSVVSDGNSLALGYGTNVSGSYSAAIGSGASTAQNNSMVLGGSTTANRVSVGIGTNAPNQQASLDLADTDKGFLVNRLTTALRSTLGSALSASEQGMMVYDTDENILYTWDGTAWNSATNTDDQDLSLSGNTLSLTNDATSVDLSSYLDNTDAQTLSLTGTDLTISNGNTVDLSSIDTDTQLTEAQVDAYVANNGYLTSFTEVDGDPTNELQDISLSGSDLTITSGSTIDLSVIDTDTQLSEAQVDAYVANNGYLTSFTEVDGDPNNEIQDISLSGTDLTISSGSTVDLSVIDTDTQIDSTGITALGFVAGPHTVDTDQQDLVAAFLTGTILQIDIQNGASVTVDLAPLLNDLQNQITLIDDRVTVLEGCACDSSAGLWNNPSGYEHPILYQNIPNPFNNTSSIKYYIPTWANSANLVVSDEQGKLISNITLNEVGAYGIAYINADGLVAGTYYYTLYVNQSLIDTKKMVIEH